MDALARLVPMVTSLMSQVDDALARHGAPADHAVWALLRRNRMLPGDAVSELAHLLPGPWLDDAEAIRRMRDRFDGVGHRLSELSGWEGPSGESLDAALAGNRVLLNSMSRRQADTAAYLDEVAQWCSSGRAAMAHTLSRVISSAEAVTLVTGGFGEDPIRQQVLAAADVGLAVLETYDRIRAAGETLARSWKLRLAEADPAATATPDATATSRTVRAEF